MHPAPGAPKDTGQKWLAFGALVIVAVGVSLGANALKTKLASTLPKKEEVPLPRQTTDPYPPPVAPARSVAAPVVADDGPPPAPGTPQSSLKARPPWGILEIGTRGEPTKQFAPQHSKAADVFAKASPMNGDVNRGFVICRAQSFAKADTFAGDDLHVRATFGRTPEVAQDGPEDKNLGFVSAPLVSLAKNEIVHVAVFDRDVFELTSLARVNVTYAGAPIVIADPGATIECRSLTGDALQSRVATDAGAADFANKTLASTKLHGRTTHWGYPYELIESSHRAVGDVAALVGWDDARTKKLVVGVASAIASVDEQKAQVFDELHSGAGNETTVDGVKVTLVSVECGPKVDVAGRCRVNVSVTNGSGRAMGWSIHRGLETYVATRGTSPQIVSPSRPDLIGQAIANGASADASLQTWDDRPGKEDAILGVCIERQCGVIKLR